MLFFLLLAISLSLVQAFSEKPSCVTLYIDYGILNNEKKTSECIDSNKVNALDFIKQAGYKTEGTVKYGDAVLCRLNGLPSREKESCNEMPPEDAYWAVIIKKRQTIPFTTSEWGWAEKAINETYLNAGDKIGLVFSSNGELKWP